MILSMRFPKANYLAANIFVAFEFLYSLMIDYLNFINCNFLYLKSFNLFTFFIIFNHFEY